MAMAVKGAAGIQHEPNVVPMIDILLVLLIIFMAALPSMRKAIDVQLPDPTPKEQQEQQDNLSIVLEVLPGGLYSINKEQVNRDGLGQRLREIYDPRPEKIIFIKGDPTVKYQDVLEAMDIARGSGVKVIGVPPKDAAQPAAAPATQ
jgi:biopolymer transport protein ExbD